ncbi:MAG: winged helix-turn-helix domain-containing protein [Solirubrobacterales bacterium]|nr:winged helix-turn-helix domain-containing protein [Solirubrobacterales bacterium]
MRFGILGPLEVVDDHERVVAVSARKQRALLTILLLHANEVVSADRLVEDLWSGAPPATADKGLQVHVSRLRRVLAAATQPGEERLLTEGSGYVLAVAAGELDSERFKRLVEEAGGLSSAGSFESAVEKLSEALALWRGGALSDFEYEEFAQAEIARLSELRVVALEQRVAAELELGRAGLLVGEVERLVREHPYRERLRGQLMLTLYRSGRQAEALEAYRDARRVLVEELGIEPSVELRELHDAILAQGASLTSSAQLVERPGQAVRGRGRLFPRAPRGRLGPTNLPPQPRALVGRARELSELRELLLANDRQIITLAGIGGSGKTRLALAVAHALLDEFPGGVFLVRLAGVSDPASLLPMIAEAAGVTGQSKQSLAPVLAARLGSEPTLLVLDNFEQLVSGAAILSELVEGADALRALVTSQVPLRIAAERILALGPLVEDDAVDLFVERARGAVAGFAPHDAEFDAIGEICARVDHMPLAIELAAARVSTLAPRALAERLERPLALLTRAERDAPARQRSLRAAINWTHALLDPAQRSLFARLGVCAGAVPLTALEAIAPASTGEAELLDALAGLLDFSFVRRLEDHRVGARFLVPQALRDFALERLIAAGLEEETRRLHAEYVARVAYAARLVKWGASDEQRAELLAVSSEIRPAVAWAREHEPRLHVRICAALASYWVYGGVLSEVTTELDRARASGAGTAAERAWLLTALAKCAQLTDVDYDVSALADQALAEWAAVDDELERALGLGYMSWVVRWEQRYDDAIAMAAESLAVLRRTDDRRLILRGLVFLAHAYADPQDVESTEAILTEAEELADGDPSWELAAIHGDCEQYKGNDVAALTWWAESLTWTSTTGESHQMLMDIGCIGDSLARLGDGEAALEVFELLRLERERTGRPGNLPTSQIWIQEAVAAACKQVDPKTAQGAAARARDVPVTNRAARVIQVVNRVLALATQANQPIRTRPTRLDRG